MQLRGQWFLIWGLIVTVFSTVRPAFAAPADTSRKAVFDLEIKDGPPAKIFQLFNEYGRPAGYCSSLTTPVCEEKLCYNISIMLYWDVLGNFQDYKLPAGKKLTKFDHDPFSPEDHKKLRQILADKASPLSVYHIEDLVDKRVKIYSKVVVDAVTGATNVSIKKSVVPGAVYTCYVLWHLVNGEASTKMAALTESVMSPDLLKDMLSSGSIACQFYALEKISPADAAACKPLILKLITSGKDYIPFFAIAKLPDEAWNNPKNLDQFISILPDAEFKLQNELLTRLKKTKLQPAQMAALIHGSAKLSDAQIRRMLDITQANQAAIDKQSSMALRKLVAKRSTDLQAKVQDILQNALSKQ